MKVLILGGGGREHALAYAIKKSALCTGLWCAPGNAGTAALATNCAINICDVAQVLALHAQHNFNLVVVGGEAPLAAGVSDALTKAGVAVFGPSQAAAQLELSKNFAREVCAQAGVRIPQYALFTQAQYAQAAQYVAQHALPVVIKADGPAAGKGVVVATTHHEAQQALQHMLQQQSFGDSSAQVLIEECIAGPEVSFFALCDGTNARFLGTACDYKRVGEGDTGANTGGMGAYSPAPQEAALIDPVLQTIVQPVLRVMQQRGTPYKGVLYVGLMLTAQGPAVIEFNARFGDPETQVLMLRLQSDALALLQACALGQLDNAACTLSPQAAVTINLCAQPYPQTPRTGMVIEGLAHAQPAAVQIFHAGTTLAANNTVLVSGGRVLSVTASANSMADARALALTAAQHINFDGMFYRRDIAAQVPV